MFDFQKLSFSEFENLIGLLLKREGHEIVHGPGAPGTRGPDYETITREHQRMVVEIRHSNFASGVNRSTIFQFIGDLERYRQQKPEARGLLIVSGPLTASATQAILANSNVDVWDRETVSSLLSKHKDLELLFGEAVSSKKNFDAKVQSIMGTTINRANELTASLRALPCGRNDWRQYERLCTEILTYVFAPDLAAPDIQSRSDDGLDIIDAIFPIRSSVSPWILVRSEYRTRFVVAEFKNYCDPIGQQQVESIAQYLWRPAQRFFGLLVSRQEPSASAIAQRRRKWLEEEKCIVFLSDDDLAEMLQLREAKAQPFDVIDTQLEEFFRTLVP